MVKIRRIFLPGMVAAIQITNTNWRNPTDLSPPTDEWNYSNCKPANEHSSVEFTGQQVLIRNFVIDYGTRQTTEHFDFLAGQIKSRQTRNTPVKIITKTHIK
jgi:hypothetical protein